MLCNCRNRSEVSRCMMYICRFCIATFFLELKKSHISSGSIVAKSSVPSCWSWCKYGKKSFSFIFWQAQVFPQECFSWPTRPRLNRWSLFSRRLSVHPSHKQLRATTDTKHENNDHLLAGTWWVTLKSPDLFSFLFFKTPSPNLSAWNKENQTASRCFVTFH